MRVEAPIKVDRKTKRLAKRLEKIEPSTSIAQKVSKTLKGPGK